MCKDLSYRQRGAAMVSILFNECPPRLFPDGRWRGPRTAQVRDATRRTSGLADGPWRLGSDPVGRPSAESLFPSGASSDRRWDRRFSAAQLGMLGEHSLVAPRVQIALAALMCWTALVKQFRRNWRDATDHQRLSKRVTCDTSAHGRRPVWEVC